VGISKATNLHSLLNDRSLFAPGRLVRPWKESSP
jgi:hypothetical protein